MFFFIFFIYRRLRKFGSIIVWNWIISYCFVDRFKVILINFGFFFIFICVCVWVRIFVIGIEGWIFVLYFLFILFWNINKLECWYWKRYKVCVFWLLRNFLVLNLYFIWIFFELIGFVICVLFVILRGGEIYFIV